MAAFTGAYQSAGTTYNLGMNLTIHSAGICSHQGEENERQR